MDWAVSLSCSSFLSINCRAVFSGDDKNLAGDLIAGQLRNEQLTGFMNAEMFRQGMKSVRMYWAIASPSNCGGLMCGAQLNGRHGVIPYKKSLIGANKTG
jgi:hypothetical protein